MTRPFLRSRPPTLANFNHCFMAACLALAASDATVAQDADAPISDEAFAKAIVGRWSGSGTYGGNKLNLERDWSFELNGHFLRGDMRVLMPNGGRFRILTFWRKTDEDRYQVLWLDEAGQSRTLTALVKRDATQVEIQHLSDGLDGPRAWQRTTYRITGADSYTETIYRSTDAGWEQVAEFNFKRQDETDASPAAEAN